MRAWRRGFREGLCAFFGERIGREMGLQSFLHRVCGLVLEGGETVDGWLWRWLELGYFRQIQ